MWAVGGCGVGVGWLARGCCRAIRLWSRADRAGVAGARGVVGGGASRGRSHSRRPCGLTRAALGVLRIRWPGQGRGLVSGGRCCGSALSGDRGRCRDQPHPSHCVCLAAGLRVACGEPRAGPVGSGFRIGRRAFPPLHGRVGVCLRLDFRRCRVCPHQHAVFELVAGDRRGPGFGILGPVVVGLMFTTDPQPPVGVALQKQWGSASSQEPWAVGLFARREGAA